MGYAYEDEDYESIETETEEVEEELDTPKEQPKKLSVKDGYTINNLLDQEDDTLALNDMLTQKDQKLFASYLGENHQKITSNKFNWAGFFFGGAYLIYRRVYFIGIFWLLITLGVQIIFPFAQIKWYITLIFEILFAIACGYFANSIIMNNAASKILNLKIKKDKDIKKKITRMGGTKISGFIIAIAFSLAILIPHYYNFMSKLINDYKEEHKTVLYDGIIIANEHVDITRVVEFPLPNAYHEAYFDTYRYFYASDKDLNVSLVLLVTDKYGSSDALIKGIAAYENKSPEDIEKTTINNNEWQYINTEYAFYATAQIKGNVYYLKHTHRGDKEYILDYNDLISTIIIK